MNLATLNTTKAEARRALSEYRASVKERQTVEDRRIMDGLRAQARGKQLIDLQATIRQAGRDERGWPRLAVCRADWRWCRVDGRGGAGVVDFGGVRRRGEWADQRRTRIRVEMRDELRGGQAEALVPLVPLPLRPANLNGYHVLWEAEWQPAPPVDPALLKHIGGDLYAVVAMWDLTDLERTVLAGRIR